MPTRVYFGKAVSGSEYVNNGGSIVNGGNVPSGAPITNVPTVAQVMGKHSGSNGSIVPYDDTNAGGTAYTAPIASGSDWALMTAGRYVMRSGGANCRFLAGVANTTVEGIGNAAGQHHSIHMRQAWSTTPITSWDYATGVATKGTATSDNFIVSGSGNDKAANPTRAIPGRFSYLVTGISATTTSYAARTQW